MWLGVLIVLYLTSRMWIRYLERDTPFRTIKRVKRFVRIASTVTFLLASFTLLGFKPGPIAATLQIHLQEARTEYGVLEKELGTALTDLTISRAYENASKSLPGAGDIPDLLGRSLGQESNLRRSYAEAKAKEQVRDRQVETLLKRCEERETRLNRANHAAKENRYVSVEEQEPVPPENATYEEISKARGRVEEFNKRYRPEVIRLLRQPGGKEIALEIPGGAISHLAELLSPLSEAFPPAKPVIDVVKLTITDTVKLALKRKLDDLTESVIEYPERVEVSLPAAAQEIADAIPPNGAPETRREVKREVAELRREVDDLQAGYERVSREMSAAEVRRNRLTEPIINRDVETAAENERLPQRRRREFVDNTEPVHRPYSEPLPSIEPFRPLQEPNTLPGMQSSGGQCICETYVNGMLVSSVPISPGQVCGGRVCQ